MFEVLNLVEGQTEARFVDLVLTPHFGAMQVYMQPILLGGRGGTTRPWPRIKKELCQLVSNCRNRQALVTTMFDYYKMPRQWPGREAAGAALAPPPERARIVEDAIAADIRMTLGHWSGERLVPYVQMHEFEALIFAEPSQLETGFPDDAAAVRRLCDETAGLQPEDINDSEQTAPSKRLTSHLPAYSRAKVAVAPDVLQAIGLDHIRAVCPRFADWLSRLESLAPEASS